MWVNVNKNRNGRKFSGIQYRYLKIDHGGYLNADTLYQQLVFLCILLLIKKIQFN